LKPAADRSGSDNAMAAGATKENSHGSRGRGRHDGPHVHPTSRLSVRQPPRRLGVNMTGYDDPTRAAYRASVPRGSPACRAHPRTTRLRRTPIVVKAPHSKHDDEPLRARLASGFTRTGKSRDPHQSAPTRLLPAASSHDRSAVIARRNTHFRVCAVAHTGMTGERSLLVSHTGSARGRYRALRW
jgi:hypothetical protein